MGSAFVLFEWGGVTVTLFASVFVFIWLLYLWETYLSFRQRRVILKSTILPHELESIMDEETFKKSRSYALDKGLFTFVSGVYHILQLTCFLYFFILPWLWYKVIDHSIILDDVLLNKFGFALGLGPKSEIYCSMIFFFYMSCFVFLDSLPWSIYSTFVIEARYGFNSQTFGFFMKDKIKAFVITLVIGMPVISGLIWIIKVGGQYFYIYAFLFSLSVTMFMMFIYPEFIAPLFDRYEPLPEGSLRMKIEALASRIKFPLKKLLVVEGSKRSAHSNAYFYGFGQNKRIVLYDTLIRGFKFPGKSDPSTSDAQPATVNATERGCANDEQVTAVLAHELGHWKLGHTIIYLFIGQANLLLMFVIFGMLMNFDPIFVSFGFRLDTPVLLKLIIIFHFIFSPYNTVLDFLMTVLSRRLEFQADRFAVDLGYADHLCPALITLQKDNLSFPICDWLYSMFTYSHPPLLERISTIESAKSKAK